MQLGRPLKIPSREGPLGSPKLVVGIAEPPRDGGGRGDESGADVRSDSDSEALRERGAIRGYHADVDPAVLGRPLQAMIAVRLQSHARGHIPGFMAKIAELPEVINVLFLGGANDFLVHIAATNTSNLRDFVVVNLSGNPDVALTETNLIFEHVRAGVTH